MKKKQMVVMKPDNLENDINLSNKKNKFKIIASGVGIVLLAIIYLAVKSTYAGSGIITFRGDSGYNLSDNSHYNSPPNGECEIDEHGYIDPDCGYLISCVCRQWSKTKACNPGTEGFPCQGTALYSADIFVTSFSNNEVFYCYGGSSYTSACDVTRPTEACYECTTSSGVAHTKTINTIRAEVYTGGNSCHVVADSECEPAPTEEPTPTPTVAPTPTPTEAPTPTPTVAPTPTPTVAPTPTPTVAPTPTPTEAPTPTPTVAPTPTPTVAPTPTPTVAPTPTPTVAPTPTPTVAPTPTPTVAPTPTPTVAPTPTPTVAPTPTPTVAPTPTESCYQCNLGTGYEYAYATSPNGAQNATGGTNCVAVPDNKCTNRTRNCYECTVDDGKTTGYYNTVNEAKNDTGSDNCTIVNESSCEITPNVNPKTGIFPGMIVIMLVGILAFVSMVRYVIKKI